MRARNRRTGAAIVASLEVVYGRAGLTADGFGRDAEGRITHEHDGSGTEPDWNTSETAERNGQAIYLDAKGEEVAESEVELYEGQG